MLLPRSFFTRPDVITIAKELLGKYLVTRIEGQLTSGIIVETEAYEGIDDKASHAFGNRRTQRTEVMYSIGGTAYVYLCYGMHSLFNVVTNKMNIPHAVLIRGIQPVEGVEIMLSRSGQKKLSKGFGTGPGKVTKALGIHYSQTGLDLTKMPRSETMPGIWLEERDIHTDPEDIVITPRIGVGYAGEDAHRPNRFQIRVHKKKLPEDSDSLLL